MSTFKLRQPFTQTEHEIAIGIGDERTYVEIGRALDISPHTVRYHVRMMAMKIDQEAFFALAPRALIYMLVKQREWEHARSGNGSGNGGNGAKV